MVDDDAAACVHPGCSGTRSAALHGCSMYRLEPYMDTGEPVPRPEPVRPRSKLWRDTMALRDRLEKIYRELSFGKQPWDRRRELLDRSGRVSEDER